jgi:hypothetical protein
MIKCATVRKARPQGLYDATMHAYLFDHFTPLRIRCAAIGWMLTHLSSASDVVRTFDARLIMKIVR